MIRRDPRSIFLFFIFLSFGLLSVQAQNVGINTSGNAPNSNAMLDVESSSMGLLIPRMTNSERSSFGSSLGSGDEGMTVYDTDDIAYYVWDGSSWVQFDMDPDNETISGINLTGSNVLEVTEAGNTYTQNLSSLGVNSNLTLDNDTLKITDPGGTLTQDLSSLGGGGGGGHWSRNSTESYLYPSNAGDSVLLGHNARPGRLDARYRMDGGGFAITSGSAIYGKATQYNGDYNINIGVFGEAQGYSAGPGFAMSFGVLGMVHPDSSFLSNALVGRLGHGKPTDWSSYPGNSALLADANGMGKAGHFTGGAVTINFNSPQSWLHVANGDEADLENGGMSGYIMAGTNADTNLRIDSDEILAQNDGVVGTLHLQQPGGSVHIHQESPTAEQVVVTDTGAVGIGTDAPTHDLHVTGNVQIDGDFDVAGTKNFRIDHPEKPDMDIYHAAIESNKRYNKYSGNVVTDEEGIAVVELPEYVELINKNFRYNLTVIGQFADAIVRKEVENDRFVIETDKPEVKVSWELTGVRDDPYSQENPYEPVRPDKK